MTNPTAVYIAINSIQDYVFQSNRLVENIGASQITDHEVFCVVMQSVLREQMELNMSEFKDCLCDPDQFNTKFRDNMKDSPDCEVGYIGGGSALLFLDSKFEVKKFVRTFSKALLLNFPGLKTSFAFKPYFNKEDFANEMNLLKDELNKNKNYYSPNTSIQKHGITADCSLNNESAEDFIIDKEYRDTEDKYISAVAKSKISKHKRSTLFYNEILEKYPEYLLTTKAECLGQNDEAGYVAVVHIDANNMGNRLALINKYDDYIAKSNRVRKSGKEAMNKLLEHICISIKQDERGHPTVFNVKLKEKTKETKDDKQQYYLPIRPVLVGGDDITFICEGRLGVYLAQKFIEYFVPKDKDNDEDKIMDGACAGVAIVKTKFPFYKAYTLADELCLEAKRVSRDTKESYLSYYYSATTFSGTLEQLRKRTHHLENGRNLYFGPYNLTDTDNKNSIENLTKGIYKLGVEKNEEGKLIFPKNKVMKLRDVFIDSDSEQELFIKELKNELPDGTLNLWDNENKTKFFDQIELIDFYQEVSINNGLMKLTLKTNTAHSFIIR